MASRREAFELEEVEDALVDGDVPYQRGTAQAALRHRNFRIVYFGTFASNIGTWMQNVILGAYAYDLTHSGAFVSLLYFGQLGPLLFLSLFGGVLADVVDRKRFLVGLQVVQGLLSFVLAAVAWQTDPSRTAIVVLVFAIGIANALGAPGLSAILPTLVPREDLPGAVALTSVQMNLSRVIGPAIGGVLYTQFHAGPGVRDQRGHVRVRGDRTVVGALSAARVNARIEARHRAFAVRPAHRPARSADPGRAPDALDVLVLLGDIRRHHAGHRGVEPRYRAQEQ